MYLYTLDIFTDNYQDWVNLAKSFVGNNYAHDIVHEAYLKLNNKKDINRSYIYLTIKHLSLDLLKANQKITKLKLNDYIYEENQIDEKIAYDKLISKIDEEINSWRWYDSKLFNIYKKESVSMREISLETGISVDSIFHTIKYCKTIIRNVAGDDYKKYKDKDYERI